MKEDWDEGQPAILYFPKMVYNKLREMISLDKRSLALLRCGLALCTLWDLWDRARDLETFYSDIGVFPRSLVLSHFTTDYWSSLHMFSGDTYLMGVLFFIHAVIAVMMLFGYKTKLVVALNWYFTVSLQTRNIIVFHSGDNVFRMAMFWCMFLPLGECFSIDAAFKDQKQKRKKEDYSVFSFASLAFTFQLMIMYYVAQRHKTAPQWREEGIAAWMALQIDFFQRPFAHVMLMMPSLLKISTFGVLYWQKYGPLFFFSPVFTGPARIFGVFGFTCMHWGFFLPMRLGLFGWATVVAIVGCLPAYFWDSIVIPFFWTKKRRNFRLYYLDDCGLCTNLAKLLSTFLLLPGTQVSGVGDGDLSASPRERREGYGHRDRDISEPTDESTVDIPKPRLQFKNTWLIAEDQHGNLHRNWDAFVAISDVSVVIWLWKPVLKKMTAIGDEIMDLIHDHGSSHHRPSAPLPKRKVQEFSKENKYLMSLFQILMRIGFEIMMVVLLYTLWSVNAQAAGYPEYNTPSSLHTLSWTLHFPQNWGMFSPRPPDTMWWYNIRGELDNGTVVEVFARGGLHNGWEPGPYEFRYKGPDLIISFKNHRWFKFFEVGLNAHRYADQLRLSFGKWLCREYNKRHQGSAALHKHDIIFVSERVDLQKLDGSRIPTGESTIWKHLCYLRPDDKP